MIWLGLSLLLTAQVAWAQPKSGRGAPLEQHMTTAGTGVTPQQLEDLTRYLETNLETTGMMILQGGKVLYEYGDVAEVSYLASCRKSVLAMLYGKHVENGTIRLDETLGELGIDDNDGLLPVEKTATVDHIITARSGVFHRPANGGYDEDNVLPRGAVKPGEYWLYNNWDFNVGGHILKLKTGNSVYEELETQLAIPLGFEDWNIRKQKLTSRPGRSQYPAYHMYLSTRDMAKIGQLMLNEGMWEGKQLISKAWMEKITTTVTPTETVNARLGQTETAPLQLSYSYMWWMVESLRGLPEMEGAYSATGWGGQFITVIPKLDMVIAHKCAVSKWVLIGLKQGGVPDWEYWDMVYEFLKPKGAAMP